MPPVVRLKDVVDEMQAPSDDFRAYLNRATGELASVGIEELSAVEEGYDIDGYPTWQQGVIRKADEILSSDDWLRLPTKFEIHEWEIMRDFCYSVEDDRLSRELLDAIHGSGAFRHFNSTIRYRGIEQDWYHFRDEALRQIAREWLERHAIPFVEK